MENRNLKVEMHSDGKNIENEPYLCQQIFTSFWRIWYYAKQFRV